MNEIKNPLPAEEVFGVMNSLAAAIGLTVAVVLGRKKAYHGHLLL